MSEGAFNDGVRLGPVNPEWVQCLEKENSELKVLLTEGELLLEKQRSALEYYERRLDQYQKLLIAIMRLNTLNEISLTNTEMESNSHLFLTLTVQDKVAITAKLNSALDEQPTE